MPTALVTGANSGIGLELAKLLAADQYDLVLVARDRDRLKSAKHDLEKRNVSVTVIVADLTDSKAIARIHKEVKTVDVLVNNAGFGLYEQFWKTDWNKEHAMIDVNVAALTELTKRYLPGMLKKGHGRILNVASTAAFQPGPGMAVYYATKAYVLSFSEALHEELRQSGVTVSCLCPGWTKTRFQERARLGRSRIFARAVPMPAGVVARAGYDGMLSGKAVIVPGAMNKLGVFLTRLLPRAWTRRFVKKWQEEA